MTVQVCRTAASLYLSGRGCSTQSAQWWLKLSQLTAQQTHSITRCQTNQFMKMCMQEARINQGIQCQKRAITHCQQQILLLCWMSILFCVMRLQYRSLLQAHGFTGGALACPCCTLGLHKCCSAAAGAPTLCTVCLHDATAGSSGLCGAAGVPPGQSSPRAG